MQQSGLADLLPSLRAVWVGLSGGSIVMAPHVGEEPIRWKPPAGGDRALGGVGPVDGKGRGPVATATDKQPGRLSEHRASWVRALAIGRERGRHLFPGLEREPVHRWCRVPFDTLAGGARDDVMGDVEQPAVRVL